MHDSATNVNDFRVQNGYRAELAAPTYCQQEFSKSSFRACRINNLQRLDPKFCQTWANLLILFDGGVYTNRIPTPRILDNLYADHKIGPTVAVFVDNGGGAARSVDLYFSDAFVKFLTDDLLPWVERQYKFKADPLRTVLGGDSLGGLAAAYAALRRPDVFGKVLSQSGAFQVEKKGADSDEPEWLARQFAQAEKSNVFFCLDVGQMEDRRGGGTTLLAANRHLRDILMAKGYRTHYFEVYGDHDPVHWRRTLPEALMATLGN